jgi:hypothetical protein
MIEFASSDVVGAPRNLADPIYRLTVMTPGRQGVHRIPYGTIEFTDTSSQEPELPDFR